MYQQRHTDVNQSPARGFVCEGSSFKCQKRKGKIWVEYKVGWLGRLIIISGTTFSYTEAFLISSPTGFQAQGVSYNAIYYKWYNVFVPDYLGRMSIIE